MHFVFSLFFLYLYLCLSFLYFIFIYGWYLYLCLWPCLVHVVFVHPCIKSLVDQVQHLKELKRAAGPRKVVEPVNLGKEEVQENKIWFIVQKQAQKHGRILSQRLDLTSEKRTVADSNISEVGLPYFRFSATDFGNIWWINFSDLKMELLSVDCWFPTSSSAFSSQSVWRGELKIESGGPSLHSYAQIIQIMWHILISEKRMKSEFINLMRSTITGETKMRETRMTIPRA